MLHGFHEQDFYYRSVDFFLMSIRICLLIISVIKSHVHEVSSLKNVLQDLVEEWLITALMTVIINAGIYTLHVGLYTVLKSAYMIVGWSA